MHACTDCDTFPYDTAEDLEYHRRCAHQGVNAKTRQPRNYSDDVARHLGKPRFPGNPTTEGIRPQERVAAMMSGNTVTEKQMTFIKRLLDERTGDEKAEAFRVACNQSWKQGVLDKRTASAVIDALMAIPKPKKAKAQAVALDDGIYEVGGNYVLVYHTVHGANQQVAKELVIIGPDEEGKFTGEWNYVGKAGLRRLTPDHKLSEEDARKFGTVYGICVRCARTLTANESKHVGYGATCAGHEGWWYPTAAELRELTKEAATMD